MHRSRLSLLAIVAAAACSTRGDATGTEVLSKDPSLVASLQDRQKPWHLPLPDVCGSIGPVVRPSVAAKREAQELTRRGYDAELVGNADSARVLLTRAVQLDATDRSAAYHLGRANESLGDRAGALAAYCHYIALTPTMTESAEARQRVATLAERETRVAAGSIGSVAPTAQRVAAAPVHRVVQSPAAAAPPQSVATPRQPTRVAARQQPTRVPSAEPSTSPEPTSPARGTYSADGVVDGVDGTAARSDGASVPTVVEQQPVTPAPTVSRGPSRMQSAGIGAIAGAIIGAATGRSVRSAVIGAAAGGAVGTVVGGTTRPTSRSMRAWPSARRSPGYRPGG